MPIRGRSPTYVASFCSFLIEQTQRCSSQLRNHLGCIARELFAMLFFRSVHEPADESAAIQFGTLDCQASPFEFLGQPGCLGPGFDIKDQQRLAGGLLDVTFQL